jgi:putative oxidoreductase
MEQPSQRGRGFYAKWGLQILTALVFITAGSSKLIGATEMAAMFQKIGIGQWFRYATGAIEVSAGLALLHPKSAFIGAGLLVCTMIGAVFTHLFLIGGNPVPALILLGASAAIGWLYRP